MTMIAGGLPSAVEALVLFGSAARNETDLDSDRDLAVFAHVDSPESLTILKMQLVDSNTVPNASFSVYSVSTAELMAKDGSLFLHHLRGEGAILFRKTEWIIRLMDRLAPYRASKAFRDIETFEIVLSDIRKSLMFGESTISFEASTLFSVLRSLGMIATTLKGQACFGRVTPIFRLRDLMGVSFPLGEEEISQLSYARLLYARNKNPSSSCVPSASQCLEMTAKVTLIARFVREMTQN